jgi:signal transduction histidine kinase
MPVWANLSLRRKGLVVIAIPVLTAVLAVALLIGVSRKTREAQGWQRHTLQVTGELQQTLQLVIEAQAAMRGYIVVRDPQWLEPFDNGRQEIPNRLEKLRNLVADNPEQVASIGRLRGELNEWLSSATLAVHTPAENAAGVVQAVVQASTDMAEARRTIEELIRRENQLLVVRAQAVAHGLIVVAWAGVISLPLGLIGALAGIWVYSRGVVKRIHTVRRNADRLLTDEPFEPVPGRDEIGELAQRFASAATLLRERTDELEAFTYSVSHDLRAPLRHVSGFAQLLRQRAGDQLDEVSTRYVDTITTSAERMGQLIDDLLVLSRIGRTEIQRTRVALEDLVTPIVAEQRAAATDRQLDVQIAPMPDVHGDASLLKLAFTNLVSNAVKYSRKREDARVEVGVQSVDEFGSVVLFVRDNGVGFDMQYVDRLFGVFQRLHRQDEFEGTGIGLAIVRRVVHRHGGRVWAEGVVGGGATFFLSLPRAEDQAG